MKNQPIFIVGALRSGTTLLRLLIDCNSKVNIFGEFEAAVSLCNDSGWPEIGQYHAHLELDRQITTYSLRVDKSLDYPSLVKSLFNQLQERTQKPHVGACIHSNIHVIPQLWPHAKLIFLIRDPRDVARSCISMGWVGNVYYGSDYWLDSVTKFDVLQKNVDDKNLLVLKYEDLVADPEFHLKKLCKFIGVDYEEEMLNIQNGSTYQKPDAAFAFQWMHKLNDRDVELVEYRCYKFMKKFGYQLTHENPNAPRLFEQLKLYANNRIGRMRFSINRWGFGNWFLYIVSKKVPSQKFKRAMQLKINAINKMYLK